MEKALPASNAHVATAAREVEEFVAENGWDQPPQLFALVPTQELLARQPDLVGHVDPAASLTPVAQEAISDPDLGDALARITWPETVTGCAIVQEIVVLPPGSEPDLAEAGGDAERLRRAAADHPDRTEARLVAAVTREGARACVMRLRGQGTDEERVDEVIEHPGLAPNLLDALAATLEP